MVHEASTDSYRAKRSEVDLHGNSVINLGYSLQETISNYTARNVIVPDATLRINEVDLSYNTFRIIFRNMIIFTLMKMDGLTLASAYHKWAESINYSAKIYGVMEYIREKMKPMVLLNRNPTLKVWGLQQ